jgi:hypothetical protein
VRAASYYLDDGAVTHLASILDHLAAGRSSLEVVHADERHSAQPGTSAWKDLGR